MFQTECEWSIQGRTTSYHNRHILHPDCCPQEIPSCFSISFKLISASSAFPVIRLSTFLFPSYLSLYTFHLLPLTWFSSLIINYNVVLDMWLFSSPPYPSFCSDTRNLYFDIWNLVPFPSLLSLFPFHPNPLSLHYLIFTLELSITPSTPDMCVMMSSLFSSHCCVFPSLLSALISYQLINCLPVPTHFLYAQSNLLLWRRCWKFLFSR